MKRDINTLSLLNEISELVYVSDPETYELLFVNQTGCQTLHLKTTRKNAMKFYRVKLHPANSVPTTDCAMIIFIPGKSQIPLSADTFYSRIK
ncbi:MAG: hypothetical protein ACLR2G_02610 [Phascolarctobacterium faecium]